jgi:hypothetical protein
MAHHFSEGQRVTVLEDGQLDDGVNQYRGRIGTGDHVVESAPGVIFYNVERLMGQGLHPRGGSGSCI